MTIIDDLANAINQTLNEYANEIGEAMDEVAYETAKEGVKLLKKSKYKLTGDYNKGWRVSKELVRKNRIRVAKKFTIYNKTDYQLTHLLEKGHAVKDGTGRVVGKVDPKIHIKPVEDELVNRITDKLAQAVNSR